MIFLFFLLGPGTAFEFAVKLVEILQGPEKAKPLPEQMLLA